MVSTKESLHQRINLGPGWQEALADEFQKPYMAELAQFLKEERRLMSIYPPAALVFNALHQTPLDRVKVVILGQDPYHGPGQAHGLCFSVPKGVPLPPSLRNIFKEAVDDAGIPPPPHGCLLDWAQQGVLLLNATLTVRQGQANSHAGKGWERFTDEVIRCLLGRGVVFILWGRAAREKVERVIRDEFLLIAPHPSPLSASSGFFGCQHFSKANRHLEKIGVGPVDWTIR